MTTPEKFFAPTLATWLALTMAACGGGGSGGSDDSNGARSGLAQRPANSSCVASALSSGGSTDTERAFAALDFNATVTGIYQSPGDDTRWFVTLKSGVIATFANDDSASTYTTLSGAPDVFTDSEGGLLALAFHPDFASNRYVYLSYTSGTSVSDMTSHVTRYTLTSDFRLTSALPILELAQPAANHNGGNIAFGPEGYLYIGFGDGGGGGDTYGNGQNPATWHAKMLRIDVDGANPYRVPDDNPFVDNTDYRPEIFAEGFRNPWKWSFDRATQQLIVADVGQNEYEEVDVITAGANYGWPITEGAHCYNASSCDTAGLTAPVFDYSHSDGGCSITGGFVYRGSAVPALYGRYLYGDYCASGVRAFTLNDPYNSDASIASAPANITAFGEGNDGEILVGNAGGELYRIVSTGTTEISVPQTLSQHPCFADATTQQLAPGVIPYAVNSALWSDAADKTRYVALPDNATITVNADGDMVFPVGSVLIKQFFHNEQLIETRLLMHHDSGWAGYSYEWNDDGTDATLSTDAHEKIIDAGYTHIFPSSAQCFACHTSATHVALGLETAQLNRDFNYDSSGITANQLDTWQHVGLFRNDLGAAQRERYMPAINDSTASVADRARAYLHSNCSGCHRSDGFPNQIDLRYDVAFADTGLCNAAPTAGDLGISGARLLTPGNTAMSILYQRMARRDATQMPPLASNVVDDAALAVIRQWIESMTGCP